MSDQRHTFRYPWQGASDHLAEMSAPLMEKERLDAFQAARNLVEDLRVLAELHGLHSYWEDEPNRRFRNWFVSRMQDDGVAVRFSVLGDGRVHAWRRRGQTEVAITDGPRLTYDRMAAAWLGPILELRDSTIPFPHRLRMSALEELASVVVKGLSEP